MDGERIVRRCSDLGTLTLFLVPDQLMRRARQARTEHQLYVVCTCRVAISQKLNGNRSTVVYRSRIPYSIHQGSLGTLDHRQRRILPPTAVT